MHLQDLQIDMAKELGMLKGGRFLDVLFGVEKFILTRASAVSTISEGMVRKVAQKQILANDCILFPNWVDEHYIRPLPKTESLRDELGISQQDRVILYSGSLGEKQGLELIIESARRFAAQPTVKFLIFGSGGGKDRLEALVHDYQLTNVRFYPLQPYEKLSALLATADVHLVLQKKSASDLVLPSKLTSILAAGGCALVSAVPGTTLYDVIHEHQMGFLIEPESADALIQGISRALDANLQSYRQNARRYAEEYLSKEVVLSRFAHQLMHLSGQYVQSSVAT